MQITLEDAKGRVIYVRFHNGKIPGPYTLAFAMEELGDGVWEAKIAMEALTLEQNRQFRKLIDERGDICCVKWSRYPSEGDVYIRESRLPKCPKNNRQETK